MTESERKAIQDVITHINIRRICQNRDSCKGCPVNVMVNGDTKPCDVLNSYDVFNMAVYSLKDNNELVQLLFECNSESANSRLEYVYPAFCELLQA